MTTPLRDVALQDRTGTGPGEVLINGNQALVRALLLQRERDRRAGLITAAYVTGYRGSPLGGLDQALWSASVAVCRLRRSASSRRSMKSWAPRRAWGTQQLATMGDATVDGGVCAVVRQGPGCRPRGRCAQARQLRRHPPQRRCAGGGGRRPPGQELDRGAPQPAGAGARIRSPCCTRPMSASSCTLRCWAGRCRATAAAGSASRSSTRQPNRR